MITIARNNYERPTQIGLVPAVCCDAVDYGVVETHFGRKRQVGLFFQLEERNSKGDRFIVGRRFSASLDKRASLRKTLETWRGKTYTDAELDKFDLELVLGAPGMLLLEEKPGKDGDVFVNVGQVMPLAKGMSALKVEAYIRKKDRPQGGSSTPHETDELPPEDAPPF